MTRNEPVIEAMNSIHLNLMATMSLLHSELAMVAIRQGNHTTESVRQLSTGLSDANDAYIADTAKLMVAIPNRIERRPAS